MYHILEWLFCFLIGTVLLVVMVESVAIDVAGFSLFELPDMVMEYAKLVCV
jgi:hypothetical protein